MAPNPPPLRAPRRSPLLRGRSHHANHRGAPDAEGVRALRRGADGARRLRPGVLRRGPADEPVHCLAEPVGLARATARALAARGQGAGAARVLVAELPAARRLALARGRRALGAARWSRRLERGGVPRRTGARRHVPRGYVAPPADRPGSAGPLRGGHVARRDQHGRRISHARHADLDRHGGRDMAPKPPHARSAPAKPWRSSATLTSRGGEPMARAYDRDLIGYGPNPPDPKWPNGARLAVNFVMNYEEGSEPSVQDGEGFSESGLTETHGLNQLSKGRDLAAETMFEYRSRVGFWQLMRPFQERRLPLTGFVDDSDACDVELPYWKTVKGRPHLVVPYSLTNNDGKYAGWTGTSDQWFSFIKDAFDMLLREGARHPKMMSVGLHMRLVGHPARAAGLERLLDYMGKQQGVWITRRLDIARHWIATHPYPGKGLNEARAQRPARSAQKPSRRGAPRVAPPD